MNPLECLTLILDKYILPALEQFLHLRIGFGDELGDQPLAQLDQKIGHAVKRDFVRNRQVMDQRQRQDDIRRAAPGQRVALPIRPAERRAGIGQVEDERQEILLLVFLDLPVVLLDGGRVNVECDRIRTQTSGLVVENPCISAQIPDLFRVERNPINVDAQQLVEAHVTGGHQSQRRQEVLAKLLVSHPKLPLAISFR